LRAVVQAAALCCGLFLSAAHAKEILPESGPIGEAAQRLLLIDAAHLGSRIVAVGDRGYVIYSDNQGASWSRAKTPPAPLLTAVSFVDAKNGWAVGHDTVILATADGGMTWAQQFSAPAEQRPLLDVLFLDAQRGIAVGAYGAYYETADGGKSWNARKVLDEDRHLNGLAKTADGKLILLGESGTILLSADQGRTWAPVTSPYKGSLFGGITTDDGAVVAYGLRGRIYRSADAGKTWKQIDNASPATLMGGTKLPDGAIVLVGAAGTVLVSRDQGQSFQKADSGSTRALAGVTLGAPNQILVLGEGGARPITLSLGRGRGEGK
jgi:photosystem II stability/assembly factor-like uncharacterized protein